MTEILSRTVIAISSEFNFNLTNQQKIYNILEPIFEEYNINKKETGLTVSDLPEKITYYLQARKLEGVADTTLQNYVYILRKLAAFTHKQASDITLMI